MTNATERTPLRVGVIGAGIFGSLHVATFDKLPTVELVAVCDLDEGRARELAADAGADWYTDPSEMMARGDLDAVSVATPDHTHTPLVLAAIDAGLHVLCEKPLAKTATESARVVEAAERAGVVVAVDFHNRVNPSFVQAKEAIAAGKLGSIRHGYLRLSNTTYVPLEMLPWSSQSSALWFLGSHGVDLLRFLLDDEVARVYAVKRRGTLVGMGVDTDDFHVAVLEFRNGAVVVIEHSWILPQSQPIVYDFKVELIGEEGALYVDTSHSRVLELHAEAGLQYPDVFGTQPAGLDRTGGFIGEAIARFVDSVTTGAAPLAAGEAGLRVAEVLEAIEESAETGVRVEI
jgi:predicted dehydrogenase